MTEARITETSIPAPLTDALSTFVGPFRPALLPNKVKDRTLSAVRDGTGALLAATNPAYSTGRPIANFAREHGGAAVATVVGHGFKTDCVNATLATAPWVTPAISSPITLAPSCIRSPSSSRRRWR